MATARLHYHRPPEGRFPCPYSPRPPIGAADADCLLMLATHAQFRRGEQAIDDVVVLPHSMIDELTIALGPDHKQRRRLSLYDSTGHLDIDFRTVVKRGDRAPGRIVAFNRVTEPQSRDIHTSHDGSRSIRARILPAQRDQLILRILPGDRCHLGLFRGTQFQQIGAPVGVDHEIGDELGPGWLDEDVDALGGTGPAVCTENLIRVDDVMESPKLAE